MKKYKLTDATKEELIEYFFNPITGGSRIGADKERFLIWLSQKRAGALLDAQDHTIEASQRFLREYIDLLKEANNEHDINKKLELFEKSNAAYEKYEQSEKKYWKLDEKLKKEIDI